MKRVVSLVLALSLMLGLVLVGRGAGPSAFVLSVDQSTIPSEGVVEVTMGVELEADSDIYGLSNYIRFPKDSFEWAGLVSKPAGFEAQFNSVPGYYDEYDCVYVSFSFQGGEPVHVTQAAAEKLVVFQLKAKPGVTGRIEIENHDINPELRLVADAGGGSSETPALRDTAVTISNGAEPAPTVYAVNIPAMSHGTVEADPSSATEGTKVKLTISPDSGYKLSAITAQTASGETVTLSGSGNTRTFTMPAEAVTVSASFASTGGSSGGDHSGGNSGSDHGGGSSGGGSSSYAISVESAANGAVTASYSRATAGTRIKLTIKPDSGYELESLTVSRGNRSVTVSGSGDTRSFTMPSGAVTVKAKFKKTAAATPPPTPTGGTITVQRVDNGSVNASKPTAKTGETVTLTALPGSGYQTASVTVKDAAGKAVAVTDAEGGKYTFVMPAGSVTVQGSFVKAVDSAADSGVSKYLDNTAHDAYLKGYKDNTIGPDKTITRAETATILFRLLRSVPESRGHFTDVASKSWYGEAVETLAGMGIIKGYKNGTFQPGKAISRAEFAAMMIRFADASQGTVQFSDTTGHWARADISAAATYGWVKGYKDGTFRPDNSITRAEAVTIINRMLDRSADGSYVTEHTGELRQFSDLTNTKAWYYYEMVEAANGHDYTQTGDKETWSELHIKG